jgi:hypothetical protein
MRVIGRILVLLSAAAVAVHFAWEVIHVDACLDGGGAFDYARRICVMEGNVALPYVPYYVRFAPALLVAATGMAIGLVLLRLQRRGRPRV